MPNHVMRDRLWESKRLRKCSLKAALAYPWIFLVADDWGRFEYDPQRICSKVFGGRTDVSVDEVANWMAEYHVTGLLVRYGADGDLAYWYNFQGRPPSQRRESKFSDPKGLQVYEIQQELELLPRGALGVAYSLTEIEQIGSEIEQNRTEQNGTEQNGAITSASPTESDAVAIVWAHYKQKLGHPRAKLSSDKVLKIRARLKDSTVEELIGAIDGCAKSSWHMGSNPNERRYDSIDLIFRNRSKVEQFLDLRDGASDDEDGPQVVDFFGNRKGLAK